MELVFGFSNEVFEVWFIYGIKYKNLGSEWMKSF